MRNSRYSQDTNQLPKFSISQEWLHELEQVHQQTMKEWPTLLRVTGEQFRHESPMTNKLQPRKAERGAGEGKNRSYEIEIENQPVRI